ncbi:MAG: histidine phosphatase family protein [Oscillospiraceae bacterium]|nr:histidine phosphatase family protein [Oscillospiraceae bacterium]
MRTVSLLRHGKTEANERFLYCGVSDLPLTAAGAEELRILRDTHRYPAKDGLTFFTSGLRRTEETLRILYGEVPHTASSDLREMDFGEFELQSYDVLRDTDSYQRWLTGDNCQNRCPGGESGQEMAARVLSAFRALPEQGDLLLVLHGGPIAAILAALFPAEPKNRYDWQPRNGQGYRILMDRSQAVSYEVIPSLS